MVFLPKWLVERVNITSQTLLYWWIDSAAPLHLPLSKQAFAWGTAKAFEILIFFLAGFLCLKISFSSKRKIMVLIIAVLLWDAIMWRLFIRTLNCYIGVNGEIFMTCIVMSASLQKKTHQNYCLFNCFLSITK